MRLAAFPFHDWRKGQREGFRTRDLHLLEWLVRSPHVESLLVIDRPVSLAERWWRREPWHVQGELVSQVSLGRHHARLTRVHEGIVVLSQATPELVRPLVRRRGWWFDAFEQAQTLEAIEWAVALRPVDASIAWQPAVWPALDALGLPFVFDSLDNWLIHPAYARWRERSRAAYASLLPAARSVFVSAPASSSVLAPWRDDIEVVPNGVDVETFREARERPYDLPSGTVVGYVGKLARRIDSDLVVKVARSRPDIAFVFVGPELEPTVTKPLHGVPNVHLLGDRHYSEIPGFVQHFDICWIPHAVGAGETGGDPIKLYEYWAAGKPVVSTRIDGLDGWADRLALVDDAAQATASIDGLLSGAIVLPAPHVLRERTWRAISQRLLAPLHVNRS